MRLFLLVILLALYSNWPSAAADLDCGAPPVVTNERVKGEVEVKANAISRILGALGFGAEYEKSREDIFSKYDDASAARADQYFYFLVCNIVLRSTTMTDQEKIETLLKMKSVMPGPHRTRPEPKTGPKIDTTGIDTYFVVSSLKFTGFAQAASVQFIVKAKGTFAGGMYIVIKDTDGVDISCATIYQYCYNNTFWMLLFPSKTRLQYNEPAYSWDKDEAQRIQVPAPFNASSIAFFFQQVW